MEWFTQQSQGVQVAIVTGTFGVITAIISGVFKLIKSRWSCQSKDNKMHDSTVNIMQSTTGNNNTFIGVQYNKDDRE